MNAFIRQVIVNDVEEAALLCKLICSAVDSEAEYTVAEEFGCEVLSDDYGNITPIDYTPMIGHWYAHFANMSDRCGDTTIKYVFKIKTEVQSAAEIYTEYMMARNYVKDAYPTLSKLQKGIILNPGETIDWAKFYEMDKRRDLATGDFNQHSDYTGLEEYSKWIA